ncbi:hypothetical protein [Chromobacterium violaceum]|nr:hypothetical protein [Chromobacterium violaceum]MBP4045536.1 hypothetical protein [Chromobacterium violaceum]
MKTLFRFAMGMAAVMVVTIAHAGAICDGKWAFITVYVCDAGPMGGTSKCMLLGRDANLDGKWDEGDDFRIRLEDGSWEKADYAKACSDRNVHLCDRPEKAQCLKN